jgi:hypothetical protein
VSALRDRVDALRARGAEVFDGPGLAFIESLLVRADAIGGDGGARLEARATERVSALDDALTRESADVADELDAMGELAPAEVRAALERGDPKGARRALKRARFEAARAREPVEVPWAARLGGDATARGEHALAHELTALCATGVIDRGAHAQAVALGGAVSSALFRSSAESVRATVAIARSADSVPESAGPYNGQVLAARALTAMAELSPAYARVVVAAIDDLAALDARLTPQPAKAKARPAKRRRAGEG